jgi:hypothetical protein
LVLGIASEMKKTATNPMSQLKESTANGKRFFISFDLSGNLILFNFQNQS